MLLVSQLAFHPMFKISTIHQHTSFNPNRRSRRSLALRAVRDMPLYACAWTSIFKQLGCKVVQSKRFSSLAKELSHNSQWSIPYNKVQNFNKCFNFLPQRFFMTLFEVTKKSSANNYKHYRKLIQWVSKRSGNKRVCSCCLQNVGILASLSFSKTATSHRTR